MNEQVSVATGAFSTRVWSEGEGDPVVFLHSFEGHRPDGAGFLASLAANRRVIAPEHPGFGDSIGADEIDEILDVVLYYRQLLDVLKIDRADVIGHGLGGMFAAEFAAICPERVNALVLVAPFGLWIDEAPVPDLFTMSPSQMQRAAWHDPEAAPSQESMSASTNGKSGPAAIVERAMDLSEAGKFLWPIPDRGLKKRLPLIEAETLVIMGASDKLVPAAYGEAFAFAIPTAKLVTIPDAGHYPHLEQPQAFLQAVEGFLAG